MKKIILVIMMVLLSSCAGEKFAGNPVSQTSPVEIAEASLAYIKENYSLRREYYAGSGVKTLSVAENRIREGEKAVYPVFYNEDILFP